MKRGGGHDERFVRTDRAARGPWSLWRVPQHLTVDDDLAATKASPRDPRE